MIYFDLPTRAKIVHEFERQLAKPGLLFLSHSESLIGIEHNLGRYDSSVFLNGRPW
jgi:chemotaxis methyl-accepting protein methylase